MCELLGVSSARKVECNELLNAFYAHAVDHPDGWGLARFYGNSVSLEKEPVSAVESVYLKNRLTDEIWEDVLIAHIRKASVGSLSYRNSHPFARRDDSGRLWTLAHNGTIFESPELEPYALAQQGSTDSERILYGLVDRINEALRTSGGALDASARFSVLEDMLRRITPKNKVNLLIYDGDLFYIHMNHADSLYFRQEEDTLTVSTRPLLSGDWQPVPMNTLLAYRAGKRVFTGTPHGNVFVKLQEDAPPAECCT